MRRTRRRGAGRDPGQPVGWPGLLRRGGPGAGAGAGLRAHLAAAGRAEGRQVEGARVGITANQGLFGHGSSIILSA